MPGAYPPWPMPPMGGQPGVPNPYAYYGGPFGSQPGGGPGGQTTVGAGNAQAYGTMPPPPPGAVGAGVAGQPPLPPPAPTAPQAHVWTEHLTPEGLRYYYNNATGTSSWDRPPEMASAPRVGNVPPLPPLPATGSSAATPSVSSAGVEQAMQGTMQAMDALSIGGGGSNGGTAYSPATSAPTSGAYAMGGTKNGLSLGGGLGLSMPAANGAGGIDALVGGSAGTEQAGVLIAEWPGSTSDLKQMFSRFGNITFADVEATTGSARVVFDSAISANHAVEVMNGYALGDKKLIVSVSSY